MLVIAKLSLSIAKYFISALRFKIAFIDLARIKQILQSNSQKIVTPKIPSYGHFSQWIDANIESNIFVKRQSLKIIKEHLKLRTELLLKKRKKYLERT